MANIVHAVTMARLHVGPKVRELNMPQFKPLNVEEGHQVKFSVLEKEIKCATSVESLSAVSIGGC